MCTRNRSISPWPRKAARFVIMVRSAATPRVGHIHVRVDDAPWVWADASGNPIILMGLLPGEHKVQIDLEDASHYALDHGMVTFFVPKTATE
jgi:hypothetical protein